MNTQITLGEQQIIDRVFQLFVQQKDDSERFNQVVQIARDSFELESADDGTVVAVTKISSDNHHSISILERAYDEVHAQSFLDEEELISLYCQLRELPQETTITVVPSPEHKQVNQLKQLINTSFSLLIHPGEDSDFIYRTISLPTFSLMKSGNSYRIYHKSLEEVVQIRYEFIDLWRLDPKMTEQLLDEMQQWLKQNAGTLYLRQFCNAWNQAWKNTFSDWFGKS
ncbi:hypothetical protein [Leptolyngbya sp. AN10]|uniref:hypothetical protein n=1 Tax=Leptolyngbya sp. AN10 TaxID=3423365 RepID=UPI003D31EBAF